MRVVLNLFLAASLGILMGFLLGLLYCLQWRANNPAGMYTLADSVYEIVGALGEGVLGLVVGAIFVLVRHRTRKGKRGGNVLSP